MAGAAGLALGGRALPVLGLAEPALAPAEVVGLAGATLTSSSLLPKTNFSIHVYSYFYFVVLLPKPRTWGSSLSTEFCFDSKELFVSSGLGLCFGFLLSLDVTGLVAVLGLDT